MNESYSPLPLSPKSHSSKSSTLSSGQALRQRTREIALRQGRGPADISLADYEQAKRELGAGVRSGPEILSTPTPSVDD